MAMEYTEWKMEKYTKGNSSRGAKMDMDSLTTIIKVNIMDSLSIIYFGEKEFLKRITKYIKSNLKRTRSPANMSMKFPRLEMTKLF
jgi:hypothetical protein